VQARSCLPDGEQAFSRSQAISAVEVERDQRTGARRDAPAVVEREEGLRQDDWLIDGPVDVPERDAGDHGCLGRLQHIRSGAHGSLQYHIPTDRNYIVSARISMMEGRLSKICDEATRIERRIARDVATLRQRNDLNLLTLS
jgi:hypothetical protein